MMCSYYLFFFKQKTAYEMLISDCSSDVCSSDLLKGGGRFDNEIFQKTAQLVNQFIKSTPEKLFKWAHRLKVDGKCEYYGERCNLTDRKSVVQGKSVSVRVDLGGRRIIKKKKIITRKIKNR